MRTGGRGPAAGDGDVKPGGAPDVAPGSSGQGYRQVSAYEKLSDTVARDGRPVLGLFQTQFCNHMLLEPDRYFVHRGRTLALEDEGPLDELRMLCNSIAEGDTTLRAD